MATIHGIVASPSPSTVREVLALQPDASAQRVIVTGIDIPDWRLLTIVFKIVCAVFISLAAIGFVGGLLWLAFEGLVLQVPALVKAFLG